MGWGEGGKLSRFGNPRLKIKPKGGGRNGRAMGGKFGRISGERMDEHAFAITLLWVLTGRTWGVFEKVQLIDKKERSN